MHMCAAHAYSTGIIDKIKSQEALEGFVSTNRNLGFCMIRNPPKTMGFYPSKRTKNPKGYFGWVGPCWDSGGGAHISVKSCKHLLKNNFERSEVRIRSF